MGIPQENPAVTKKNILEGFSRERPDKFFILEKIPGRIEEPYAEFIEEFLEIFLEMKIVYRNFLFLLKKFSLESISKMYFFYYWEIKTFIFLVHVFNCFVCLLCLLKRIYIFKNH